MISVNPLKLLLWTFRRSPGDVVDLYNTLSPVMQLATGGSMLNFGYWAGATSPLEAQAKLCDLAGEAAVGMNEVLTQLRIKNFAVIEELRTLSHIGPMKGFDVTAADLRQPRQRVVRPAEDHVGELLLHRFADHFFGALAAGEFE